MDSVDVNKPIDDRSEELFSCSFQLFEEPSVQHKVSLSVGEEDIPSLLGLLQFPGDNGLSRVSEIMVIGEIATLLIDDLPDHIHLLEIKLSGLQRSVALEVNLIDSIDIAPKNLSHERSL